MQVCVEGFLLMCGQSLRLRLSVADNWFILPNKQFHGFQWALYLHSSRTIGVNIRHKFTVKYI